jgi:hypothetical protein
MFTPALLFSTLFPPMKRRLSLLSLALLLPFFLAAPEAGAQTEGVGVGASLGVTNGSPGFDRNPVGLNIKAWTSDRQAVSGMTSFFISGTAPTSQSYWILQTDYLFHNFNQLNVGEGYLALYVGVGGQYTVFEALDQSAPLGSSRNQFALRSPLGVTYLLGSAPIDVFVEVAPTLRITEPTALRFDGAIGFRYYFTSGSSKDDSE